MRKVFPPAGTIRHSNKALQVRNPVFEGRTSALFLRIRACAVAMRVSDSDRISSAFKSIDPGLFKSFDDRPNLSEDSSSVTPRDQALKPPSLQTTHLVSSPGNHTTTSGFMEMRIRPFHSHFSGARLLERQHWWRGNIGL